MHSWRVCICTMLNSSRRSRRWIQTLRLDPGNLPALVMQIDVLDRLGQSDAARQLLARQLKAQPDSAYLQHALGLWLLHHDQREFALLGLSKAVELEPDNKEYRYDLATTLHSAEELEAAQKQLQEIVQRHPADRKARVLLINYWKESGQLQNVQVLLAQLEQLNPDDPALQQGPLTSNLDDMFGTAITGWGQVSQAIGFNKPASLDSPGHERAFFVYI
jgi:tetratricopeptide (TPR) repeat protein